MKNSVVLFLMAFVVFACSSDDYAEAKEQRRQDTEQRMATRDKECHVLIIGNSLARDAFCYVPPIMEELCPDLAVNMDIMYVSGNPLSTHWRYISNNTMNFVWDSYNTRDGAWTTSFNWDANSIVASAKWDMVIFQEGSAKARTYETTQPYVKNIIGYVQTIQGDVPYAYTIITSLADGMYSTEELTSDKVWEMNATVSERLLDEGLVSYVVPCGTAIQNARHTRLDDYGNYGHLSYDGRHLQEGIPCVVDAYAAAETILRILGVDASIENSSLRVTQSWVAAINVLGCHGAALEGGEEEYALAKRCALLAVEHPYEISTIEN